MTNIYLYQQRCSKYHHFLYFSINSITRSLNLSQVFIFFIALKLLSHVAELIGIVNAIINSFLLFIILRFSKKPTDNYKNNE
jgi:hypothetical protein